MFGFGNSFWVLVCTSILICGRIIKFISRFKADDDSHKNDANCSVSDSQQDDQILSSCPNNLVSDGFSEKENSQFSFGFQFKNHKDFVAETEDSVLRDSGSTRSTSKYQFVSGKYESGFMEEPKTISFTVEEMFLGSNDNFTKKGQNFKAETFHDEKTEDSVQNSLIEEVLEGKEPLNLAEKEIPKNEEFDILGENLLDEKNSSFGIQFMQENQFFPFDSKPESGNNDYSYDGNSNEEVKSDSPIPIDDGKVELIGNFWSILDSELFISRDKSENTDEDYIKLEPNLQNSSGMDPMDCLGKFEEQSLEKKSWVLESEEVDESDVLLEHQEMIEQMKMELKKARKGGLPTILEESETPKMVEDLKPLKIEGKIEHRDRMVEIQMFYKSYAEKMRKLDILNYQTMHAISFLQLKNPVQFTSGKKYSISEIKSLVLPNLWPCKLRRIYADPTLKSISELYRDLEVVYVGQVCLSWEILQWQYGKSKELMEYDHEGLHSYNQVAGEFQQFQVLVQRFIEDEAFQGPRIQNYVKKQCILRSLLQVPTIKDDCLKDKKGKREGEETAVSIARLAEIIEESMRVFWEFLRSDKDYANLILKGLQGTQVHLQHPADTELLMNIKTSLQKKEKRLKDILRSGNCIVKKFQKLQGGRLDHGLFHSQVDLRLVSRVLSLSRLTTDQLVWCSTKLNNISFVNRKIHVEPSFLLFPC